jgi:competence protein ComK
MEVITLMEMKILEQKQIEEYVINPLTMFIKPIEYGSKIYSQINEVNNEFISPFKPLEIIKNSCNYFGSDYEGRRNGTRQLIGYTHKIPIAIDPTNRIFFFPTTSPTRQECIWISHEQVKALDRISPKETLLTFRNKQSCTIPVSYRSIRGQMEATAYLRTELMQRIEFNERKSFYLINRPKALKALENANRYEKRKK